METLEIQNSSAISKIIFNEDENIVGISFTSNVDKLYDYYCTTFDETKTKIKEAHQSGESVGKLISSLRKEGTLEVIVNE